MKKYVFISVGLALVGVVFVLAITLMALRSNTPPRPQENTITQQENKDKDEGTTLSFHGLEIKTEVVETPTERNKGLSGRDGLVEGEGMLFVFDEMDTHSFWMPDMHFSIDIVWLDENMKVVYIKENATPESYPELFKPTAPALYVLEVPSGFSKKNGIVVGDQAVIQ